MYDLFILFLTEFLHLEQSVKLKAANSHDFRKCGNSFSEKLSEDEDKYSVRNLKSQRILQD